MSETLADRRRELIEFFRTTFPDQDVSDYVWAVPHPADDDDGAFERFFNLVQLICFLPTSTWQRRCEIVELVEEANEEFELSIPGWTSYVEQCNDAHDGRLVAADHFVVDAVDVTVQIDEAPADTERSDEELDVFRESFADDPEQEVTRKVRIFTPRLAMDTYFEGVVDALEQRYGWERFDRQVRSSLAKVGHAVEKVDYVSIEASVLRKPDMNDPNDRKAMEALRDA